MWRRTALKAGSAHAVNKERLGKIPHTQSPVVRCLGEEAPIIPSEWSALKMVSRDMQSITLQEEQNSNTSHKQLRRLYDVNPPRHCSPQSIAHRLTTSSLNLRPWSTNRSQCRITSSKTTVTLSASHTLPIGCSTHCGSLAQATRPFWHTRCTWKDACKPAHAFNVSLYQCGLTPIHTRVSH